MEKGLYCLPDAASNCEYKHSQFLRNPVAKNQVSMRLFLLLSVSCLIYYPAMQRLIRSTDSASAREYQFGNL